MRRRRAGVKLDPKIEKARKSAERWELDLLVPDDLSCLPGHFPDFPVVPGVLQLDWVIAFAFEWRGSEPRSLRVEGLKFKRPLLPGQRATLTLEADSSLDRFRFRLTEGDEVFSLGRLDCSDVEEGGA